MSNAAIAAGDPDGVTAHMADDYVIILGSSDRITGRSAVHAAYVNIWAAAPDTLYVRTPKSVKISRSGTDMPLAYEEGTWVGRWTDGNGKAEYSGAYSAGWRLSAAGWELHSELFVTLQAKGRD